MWEGPHWATPGQEVLGRLRKQAEQASKKHSSMFSALVPGLVPSKTFGVREGSIAVLNQWTKMLIEACEQEQFKCCSEGCQPLPPSGPGPWSSTL